MSKVKEWHYHSRRRNGDNGWGEWKIAAVINNVVMVPPDDRDDRAFVYEFRDPKERLVRDPNGKGVVSAKS